MAVRMAGRNFIEDLFTSGILPCGERIPRPLARRRHNTGLRWLGRWLAPNITANSFSALCVMFGALRRLTNGGS